MSNYLYEEYGQIDNHSVKVQMSPIKRLKKRGYSIMAISKMFADMAQFISEAFMRIFTPANDAYPVIGVQPFTGKIYKKGKAAW